MTLPLRTLFLGAFLLLLVACRSESDGGRTPPPPLPVALHEFGVVDSYGVDSEFYPDEPLLLDPYISDGLFEVYWRASAGRDYTFYLSLGPTRDIEDSVLVYTEDCGSGQVCRSEGYSICQYSSDFYLGCADDSDKDISELFTQVPERLYLFAEVCDIRTCNYEHRAVTFY